MGVGPRSEFAGLPLPFSSSLRSQLGEEDDVADGRGVREEHHQPVDTDALAGGGWHAVLERADVVLVHLVRLVVAAGALAELRLESGALLVGVVQLRKAVRELSAGDV